jgi:putative tryptophan/tyrosine transport system substrate-binding protein
MRRREFIMLIGGATAWPAVAHARRDEKVYRMGILTNRSEDRPPIGRSVSANNWPNYWSQLINGLRDHGYVEGQNLIIEWRYSEGHSERWSELAGELVGLNVDVILVITTPAALAAKKVTSTIPIVITAFDPVGGSRAAWLSREETLPDWGYSSLK